MNILHIFLFISLLTQSTRQIKIVASINHYGLIFMSYHNENMHLCHSRKLSREKTSGFVVIRQKFGGMASFGSTRNLQQFPPSIHIFSHESFRCTVIVVALNQKVVTCVSPVEGFATRIKVFKGWSRDKSVWPPSSKKDGYHLSFEPTVNSVEEFQKEEGVV